MWRRLQRVVQRGTRVSTLSQRKSRETYANSIRQRFRVTARASHIYCREFVAAVVRIGGGVH